MDYGVSYLTVCGKCLSHPRFISAHSLKNFGCIDAHSMDRQIAHDSTAWRGSHAFPPIL